MMDYTAVFLAIIGIILCIDIESFNKNYKEHNIENEINYLLYDEPFAKLQHIMNKDSNEESKEFIKGYYLHLENLLEKLGPSIDKKYIERIKTSCYWHKKLHYRMYNEKNRKIENQSQDFKTYYKLILNTDYKELYNICKLVHKFDTN